MESNSSAKKFLKEVINDFSTDKLIRFLREKSRKFRSVGDDLNQYDNEDFSEGKMLGEIGLEDDSQLLLCAFKVNKELTERSGKKAQYILGKKILKETARYAAGIFIFYDENTNFRFSLIYDIPKPGAKRDWSNFRRYTYFVSKELTNKTFLNQMDAADFTSLKNIIDAFSVEKVTKEFYQEIANWYFWALDKVEFPDVEEKNREQRNAKNLIRLITRIIFVWFMKEKKLVPPSIFDKSFAHKILNYNDKTGSTYYKAILQNLFFATLNTQMKKDNSKSRIFVEEAKKFGFLNEGYLEQGYYRYGRFIKDKKLFLKQFENIPFLNGGLFECLDKRINGKEIRIDCFSDNPKNETRLKIPDELFFLENEIEANLSKHIGSGKNKKVRGLLTILNSYNFTIDENTPVDQDVALDPELLGKVFENLLAAYNPETATTVRKATGSYYTPREIVEYMVNESLVEYLKTSLADSSKENEEKIRSLFDYNRDENPFSGEPKIINNIIDAIENVKILDPACGSGAFPMGILHKLVLALHKIDPDNNIWKKRLLDRVPAEIRDETEKSLENKSLDYIRKLGLIEHCIYGVDIQEIAIQISKLRFFISLLVEQQTDDSKKNRDVRSLPNLETKFVAANTLIGLEKLPEELIDSDIAKLSKKLFNNRQDIFYANSRWKKIDLEKKEKILRQQLAHILEEKYKKAIKNKIKKIQEGITRLTKEADKLKQKPEVIETLETINLFGEKKITKINKTKEKIDTFKKKIEKYKKQIDELENPQNDTSILIAQKIADFDPFDQNTHADWFDPEWMFGVKDGFDIVIGNPPYVRADNAGIGEQREAIKKLNTYKTLWEKWDLYVAFIEKGFDLLASKGILEFIIPDAYLTSKYAIKSHKYFLNNAVINRINFCSDLKIFEAGVRNIIVEFKKEIKPDHIPLRIRHLEKWEAQIILHSKVQSEIGEYTFKLNSENRTKGDLSNTLSWGEICYVSVGMVLNADENIAKGEFRKSDLVSNRESRIYSRKYLEAKWISKYTVNKVKYLEWNTNRVPKKIRRPTFPELYTPAKIMMGGMTGAIYDDSGLLCNHSIIVSVLWKDLKGVQNRSIEGSIKKNFKGKKTNNLRHQLEESSKQFNLKYLLAILNSKWAYKFLDSVRRSKLGFYPDDLKKLPIKTIIDTQQKPFIDLVDKILTTKKHDPAINTKNIENEIDLMVYKLYDLTYEEVKVIDPGFALTKEEYENYKIE